MYTFCSSVYFFGCIIMNLGMGEKRNPLPPQIFSYPQDFSGQEANPSTWSNRAFTGSSFCCHLTAENEQRNE
jgi:hypothetical protein